MQRHQRIGQPAFRGHHLLADLAADDRLEIAHHGRIGMRPRNRADDVERVLDIGDPVAQRLVHGVLERRRAGNHGPHLGAEQPHAENIGALPLDIGLAHIDHARQAEAGGHGGDGHAMLARAGLRDDAGLSHPLGEQDLAQAIVDLVRAGVIEFVALEVDLRAAKVLGQPLGVIERARPAGIMRIEVFKLGVEGRIVLRRCVSCLKLKDKRHQRFGHEAPAIKAEMTPLIGTGAIAVQVQQRFGCTGHELFSLLGRGWDRNGRFEGFRNPDKFFDPSGGFYARSGLHSRGNIDRQGAAGA